MDDSTPIIDVTAHPASGFVQRDDFWALLRRRKGSIALFWVLGVILAFWWLLTRPNVYQAESRVMVVRTGPGGPVSEAELASEIELIRDPSHVEKTAAKQRPNQTDNQVHDEQRRIEADLSVGAAGKSNLVSIRYRDDDAMAASRIVNQLVDLYLADRRFIFQTPGRAAADSSAPAQDLLSAFDALNHGPLLQTELQSRFQRRLDLENRRGELKAQIRDRQEALNVLRKRLVTLPQHVHSETRVRVSNSPPSRQVEDTEIANPLRLEIEQQVLNNESAMAGLQARLEQTITALKEAQTAEDRVSVLNSERERIERRAVEARGVADATGTDRPNLRATLINRAEPPYGPLPHHTVLWMPVAILSALLAAILIAWLLDQFDKPIYTRGDFERASGVPPLDDDQFAHGAGA